MELITRVQLAKKLNISTATIERLRRKGMPCIKIGKLVRYDEKEVREWIEKQN